MLVRLGICGVYRSGVKGWNPVSPTLAGSTAAGSESTTGLRNLAIEATVSLVSVELNTWVRFALKMFETWWAGMGDG